MLPSRGIARSLPPTVTRTQRHIANRLVNLSGRTLGNGRQQFGTLMRSSNGGITAVNSSSPFRLRYAAAAPVALGGIAAPRHISSWLSWGWGSKKSDAPREEASTTPETNAAASAESTTTTSTTTTPVPAPVETPVEAVVPQTTPPAAEPAVPTTEIDLNSLLNAEDILKMPEDIGYLHAIGLDYGWGFTSTMQWALEHIHVYSGLGWGASIVATAVLLRAIMFYPQVQSLRFNAVMQTLRKDPRSQEALKLVQQGLQERDMEMRQRGQVLNKLLRQEYGVSNWGILWGFMQIPFTFGLFRIVTGMTHVPVPSLETAGYLWFSDLTATDPYFILPAAGTAMMMGALIVNSKHTPAQQKKMLKPMMYIFGTVGFIGTTFLSSAVNFMTVSLGASTLVTALFLNIPSVRRALGLPILAGEPPKAQIHSYQAPRASSSSSASTSESSSSAAAAQSQSNMREQLTNSLNDMKKGFSESISNYTGTYQGTDEEKAERKRKDMLRKLEQTRRQQEREEFDKKYKGKK